MSRKINAPYYPLYPQDFVHSCRAAMMSAEEVGALFMVMCQQWETMGPIAHDPARFAAYTGWDVRIAKRLLGRLEEIKKIERDERGLYSSRMENEITKYVNKVRAAETREAKKRDQKAAENGATDVQNSERSAADTRLATPVATQVAAITSTKDLFKNLNKINETTTTEGALLDSDSDSERKNPPLAPQGGEARLPLGNPVNETTAQMRRRLRGEKAAAKRASVEALRGQVEIIVATYNAEAEKRGYGQCDTLTEKRLRRIAERMADVGGPDNVLLAISSIHLDDWLGGRVKGRDGKPFRMTIDHLFSDGSGLGDVLARLLDLARGKAKTAAKVVAANGGHDPNWWRDAEKVAQVTDAQWRTTITRYANGRWPVDRLGPPPGHAKCVAPKHIVEELGLTYTYDPRTGESREPH